MTAWTSTPQQVPSKTGTAAVAVPCLLLAALVMSDHTISSYFSSMGGWRWKVFLRSLAVAFVVLGIPIIVSFLLKGKTADVRFTIVGFVLLTLFVPFQSLGEELVYQSATGTHPV